MSWGSFLGFWSAVWESYWSLPDIEKLTNALGLLGPLFAFLALCARSIVRSRTRDLRRQVAGLEEAGAGLRSERDGLLREIAGRDAQLADLSSMLPSTARKRADRERADGNEERAIAALRDGFETVRPDLARICTDLALHHASIAPDFGDHHLAEAARLADLALLLAPDDADAADIRAELIEIDAQAAMAQGVYDPLDPKWDDARLFMHLGSDEDALAAFDALVARGVAQNEAGLYQLSERLLRRARAIGRPLFGETAPRSLAAAWPWLQAVNALDWPEEVLAVATDLSGRLDPFSEARATADFYRCVALRDLGQLSDALKLIDTNVELWTRLRGTDDRETLANRDLRVTLLQKIGATEAALEEVEALLSIWAGIRGSEHRDALTTRYLRASLLQDAGEMEQALAEVEALLPVRRRISGEEHPYTLATRYLRASLLRDAGEAEQALAEVEALLPVRRHISGEEHPDTLTTLHLRASLLQDAGEAEQALAEVEALLPVRRRISGPEHPDTLATRILRASIMSDLGEMEQALAEVEAVLPLMERARPEHPDILEARSLGARLASEIGEHGKLAEAAQTSVP